MLWFTSDEHYGHKNIIEYSKRPFASVHEMQEELIARHNAIVMRSDDVWHVGDFSLNEKLVPQILPRLNGAHHLIVGNHDACHPRHRKHEAASQRYIAWGFLSVVTELRMSDFTVAHMPYSGDRFAQWRPKDEGRWLLHGHVHEAWKVRGRQINVGVDQWDYGPVSLTHLERLRQESANTDIK